MLSSEELIKEAEKMRTQRDAKDAELEELKSIAAVVESSYKEEMEEVKKDPMELKVTKAAPKTLMMAHIKAKVVTEKMARVKMKVSLSLKVALMVERVVLMTRKVVMEGMTQVIMMEALKM